MCIQYVGYFCVRKKLTLTAKLKIFTRENKLASGYNGIIIFLGLFFFGLMYFNSKLTGTAQKTILKHTCM